MKGNSIIVYLEKSTKENIILVLEKIRKENPDAKAIIVILDNFRSHKAKCVLERAKELGIYLVFLPKYSPDLNPIEFIWKSVKRIISISFIKNKETFQEKVTQSFELFSKKISYAHSWITNFFIPVWNNYDL